MSSSSRHQSCPISLQLISIGVLAILAFALIAGSFMLDAQVKLLVLDSNSGHWSKSPLVARLSKYGDWPELMLLGVIGTLIARWLQSIRWQRILIAAMIASTLAGMTINLARLTTGRTRPRAAAEMGWYGLKYGEKWLIGEADFNSFPSGHTATAVGFAGVILFAAPGWGLLALLAASSVAISRILLGAHHPSDVITAATISLVLAWLVWEFLGRRGRIDRIVRRSRTEN